MRFVVHRVFPLALVLLLAQPPSPASPLVKESVSKWRFNQRIEVVLNGGDKLTGRLGVVSENSFILKPDKRIGSAREVRFAEVKSVKSRMSAGQKWAIAGVIYGVVTIFSLILGK